jgi:hypothetical protein
MTKATTKPIIRIHNVETDEIIDREMNDEEFARCQANKENQAAYEAGKAQQAAEKAALLARLGLTEDELKTILG